jgi:hypothetical protein
MRLEDGAWPHDLTDVQVRISIGAFWCRALDWQNYGHQQSAKNEVNDDD